MSFNKVVLAVVLCATVAAGAVRHLHLDNNYMVNLDITGTGNASKIELELIVTGTGYVGFGIGPNATMEGADIFIGGVVVFNETTQTPFGSDYIGTGHVEPTLDTQQDWQIISGLEANGTTTLKISRLLLTNDTVQDVEIKDGNIHVIWSIGENDTVEYHGPGTKRGFRQLNLLTADDTNSSGVTAFSVSTLIMSLVAAFLRN